jgi:hypothetical protein
VLHAVAIRLRDEGVGDHVIAVALALDDDQVPTLLRIADGKLVNLMNGSAPRTDRTDGPRQGHQVQVNQGQKE